MSCEEANTVRSSRRSRAKLAIAAAMEANAERGVGGADKVFKRDRDREAEATFRMRPNVRRTRAHMGSVCSGKK